MRKPSAIIPKQVFERDERTHALERMQYALCNAAGKPVSLHGDFDQALGSYAQRRKGIILDENSREAYFAVMLRKHWSIRKCYAWVRIDADQISKLPSTKSDKRKI